VSGDWVLVAYGSKRGGTAGIAEMLAVTLRERGAVVDVGPAGEVSDVEPYAAVVLGGALYATRWHRDARRFARRQRKALRARAVWCFSSGPLDSTAEEREIPPPRGVARVVRRIGARGHETFGGRLAPDAPGWVAHKMVEGGTVGDFRDPQHIATWANRIADDLDRRPVDA
jgi:menaquinone-dependent protoporphyrinogen oxidase